MKTAVKFYVVGSVLWLVGLILLITTEGTLHSVGVALVIVGVALEIYSLIHKSRTTTKEPVSHDN